MKTGDAFGTVGSNPTPSAILPAGCGFFVFERRDIVELVLFLLLGLGVGMFGSLVGIGGGLFCVPIFIFFLSEDGIFPYFKTAAEITGTSLFIVFVNALSGAFSYIFQKRVFFNAAIPFAIATLPGAFLGSYIVDKFSFQMLNLYFGIFMGVMAVLIFFNAMKKKRKDVLELPTNFKYNKSVGIVSSLGVGFLSSVFGVGGGIIHVPLMVYLLNFPVHIATATSTFILMISSLGGVISHFILSHIVWIPAIAISVGAAIGAQLGAKLSRKTKSKTILIILALTMTFVGVRLILSGSAN